ncbi:MAG: glycosyltransferase family 2 protein [Kiritimatiellae bacterium]|nr:glycosyltransferase family 2 protein [Kiritimatiellia bacterium]
MSAPLCSILIATRNRPRILAETFERLRAKGFGSYPMWIYDDASEDPASIADVVATWPNARLLRGEVQRGQSHGRNELFRACGTPFAICLDDDQYFLEVGDLKNHLVLPRPEGAHAVVSFQCRAVKDGRLDRPAEWPSGLTTWFMGGCVLFYLPVVLEIRGYREWWVYGYEEPELAARLFAKGHRIWYDRSILIEHNQWYNPNERRDYGEYDYLYARNAVLLTSMNYPLLMGLPLGIMRSIRRAFFLKRNFGRKWSGLLRGIAMTFTHWSERTPMRWGQALEWMRLNKE